MTPFVLEILLTIIAFVSFAAFILITIENNPKFKWLEIALGIITILAFTSYLFIYQIIDILTKMGVMK